MAEVPRNEVIEALADLTTSAIAELKRSLKTLPPQERHKLALQIYGLAVKYAMRRSEDDDDTDRKEMQRKFDELLAGVLER